MIEKKSPSSLKFSQVKTPITKTGPEKLKKKEVLPEPEKLKKKKVVAHSPEAVSKLKKRLVNKSEALRHEVATLVIPTAISTDEKRMVDEYVSMLNMTSSLIARLDVKLENDKALNSRDIYALSTLMSQQREIIADIRSVSDMSGQVASMDTNVVRPLVSSVGQNILDSMFQIRKVIIDCARKEETQVALHLLEGITTEQGKFLQQQYASALDKVNGILLG